MSVIVKGINLPASCYDCNFWASDERYCSATFYDVSLSEATEGRRDFCPLAPAPRWIPVTERLPEDGGRYLVRYVRDIDIDGGIHDDEIKIMRFSQNGGWRFPVICNEDVRRCVAMEEVTHWMPLPEPPMEDM